MEFKNEIIYNAMLQLEEESKELAYEFIKSFIQYKLFGEYDSDDLIIKAMMLLV